MDFDDLFDGLGSTRPLSKGGQRIVRLVFGVVLAVLGVAGAWKVGSAEGGVAFRSAGAAMFATLALFGVLGIAFGVRVKRLGCLFLLSVALLFVVRILFGA